MGGSRTYSRRKGDNMTLEQAQQSLESAEATLTTAKQSLTTAQESYDAAKKVVSDLQASQQKTTGNVVTDFIEKVNASRRVQQ